MGFTDKVPVLRYGRITGGCGQVFFGSLTPASDYTLDVSAVGYTAQNLTNIDVSGDEVKNITL